MKYTSLLFVVICAVSLAHGNQVSESQKQYVRKYAKQVKKVSPDAALINTDPEPNLEQVGFVDLYNGQNLDGWTPLGGHCSFEPRGDSIIGTSVPGSPSTYLSTNKNDYTDFIFTAELKWEVDGNSGIMFRAQKKPNKNGVTIYGPQCEMEGTDMVRGWSGGIYGQSAGGWFYPLWLDAHEQARNAIKPDDWNRVTIQAIGNNVKTWINGIPAANWEDDEFPKGFFSLQVHYADKEGKIHFRNIKVKELDPRPH